MYKDTPSKQDYGTPPEFMEAVRKRFGEITHDLAAHSGNFKCESYFSLEHKQDSILLPWPRGLNWLNPPFSASRGSRYSLYDWAKKCKDESEKDDVETLLLTPAAVGTIWFRDNIIGNADIYFLNGRLKFINDDMQEPTGVQIDMMVSHFRANWEGYRTSVWDWRRNMLYSMR